MGKPHTYTPSLPDQVPRSAPIIPWPVRLVSDIARNTTIRVGALEINAVAAPHCDHRLAAIHAVFAGAFHVHADTVTPSNGLGSCALALRVTNTTEEDPVWAGHQNDGGATSVALAVSLNRSAGTGVNLFIASEVVQFD